MTPSWWELGKLFLWGAASLLRTTSRQVHPHRLAKEAQSPSSCLILTPMVNRTFLWAMILHAGCRLGAKG
jgi:hypothetical protein